MFQLISYVLILDPDPFDERHPSRTDPSSELGKNLKLLFKKEVFMNRLVNDYLRDNFFTRQSINKSSFQLNISACRLILIIMPGLETSAVFQVSNDQLINRLYDWVEKGAEPLRSYATGLLGAAMDIQDIAIAYREQNIRMLPLLLRRLRDLQAKYKKYGNISSLTSDTVGDVPSSNGPILEPEFNVERHIEPGTSSNNTSVTSYSSDHPRHMILLHPPTLSTSQMLILRYLAPMVSFFRSININFSLFNIFFRESIRNFFHSFSSMTRWILFSTLSRT